MNRLWRILHHLFGDDPPPRPTGHVPHGLHRGHHRQHGRGHGHHEHGDEAGREADEQVSDAADDGPAPTSHHGH